jgi:hypothetical protein
MADAGTVEQKKQARAERFGLPASGDKASKIGAAPAADLVTI